jgi:hypothetical protein
VAGQLTDATLGFRVNAPPVADAGGNHRVGEGGSVSFAASGTAEAEAALFSYRWTFEDGSRADGGTASRLYRQDGVYPATLTVTDTAGSVASDTIQVSVDNLPPVVTAVGDRRRTSRSAAGAAFWHFVVYSLSSGPGLLVCSIYSWHLSGVSSKEESRGGLSAC